jgi:hypothetical protein
MAPLSGQGWQVGCCDSTPRPTLRTYVWILDVSMFGTTVRSLLCLAVTLQWLLEMSCFACMKVLVCGATVRSPLHIAVMLLVVVW